MHVPSGASTFTESGSVSRFPTVPSLVASDSALSIAASISAEFSSDLVFTSKTTEGLKSKPRIFSVEYTSRSVCQKAFDQASYLSTNLETIDEILISHFHQDLTLLFLFISNKL